MIDISRALTVQGFMEPPELEWLATQASHHHQIAEIGCWQGRSTRVLADHCPGTVFAIDHFRGVPELLYELTDRPPHWLYKKFTMNVIDLDNVVVVRKPSREAALLLQNMKFDMIFIDGDHTYEAVKEDIRLWKPLVLTGGILCGHDYHEAIGVAQAVTELLPNAQLVDNTSLWWLQL